MSNPTVTFRLNKYQLARGLWLLRQHEAAFRPSSASHIVKTLYLDTIAKHTLNRPDPANPQLMNEVQRLLSRKQRPETTFEDFLQDMAIPDQPPQPAEDDQSIIRTVTDFSPPTDWLDEEDE